MLANPNVAKGKNLGNMGRYTKYQITITTGNPLTSQQDNDHYHYHYHYHYQSQ